MSLLRADAWIYADPSGAEQGPFTRAALFQWLEAGYLNAELPLRLDAAAVAAVTAAARAASGAAGLAAVENRPVSGTLSWVSLGVLVQLVALLTLVQTMAPEQAAGQLRLRLPVLLPADWLAFLVSLADGPPSAAAVAAIAAAGVFGNQAVGPPGYASPQQRQQQPVVVAGRVSSDGGSSSSGGRRPGAAAAHELAAGVPGAVADAPAAAAGAGSVTAGLLVSPVASAAATAAGQSRAGGSPAPVAAAAAAQAAPVSSSSSGSQQAMAQLGSAAAAQQSAVAGERKAFLPPWLLAGAHKLGVTQLQQVQRQPQQSLPGGLPRASSTSSSIRDGAFEAPPSRGASSGGSAAGAAAATGTALRRPCLKCGAAEARVLLVPCKHLVLCRGCSDACQASAAQLPAWSKPVCPKPECGAVIKGYVAVHRS